MKKYYIVSFGNSNTYSVSAPLDADTLRNTIIERLKEKFPMGNVKAIVTIDVREVDEATAAGYPALDSGAEKAVEAILNREMQVNADEMELNNNAPYAVTESENFPKGKGSKEVYPSPDA